MCQSLGLKELTPSSSSIREIYLKETSPNEPVLFIVSPGADPSTELEELAVGTVGEKNYHQVRKYYLLW